MRLQRPPVLAYNKETRLVRLSRRGSSIGRSQTARLLWAILFSGCLAANLCAQETSPPAGDKAPKEPTAKKDAGGGQPAEAVAGPKAPTAGPPAPSAEGELNTYYLRDSKGNLVPVLGFTFEDYEKLLQIKMGLAPPPPPAFSIDSLTLTGKADGGVAELQLATTVRVRQEGWVKVPLRLAGCALMESAKYQGPGDHVLSPAADHEGFSLWLKGQGKPHQLQLKLAVPITDVGLERRLQLQLPRGTESVLRLQVPLRRVAANLRNASEGILSTKSIAGNQSEIQVVGSTGDLQLAWQVGKNAAPETKATLDVTGEIIVRVESRNRVSAEARLKLRSVGKPLETVSVRLPPGMQLVPAPATGYVVAPAESEIGKPSAGQLVDVHFDRATAGPAEIRLLAEQEVSANPSEGPLRPARFEVLGAQRQRGTIDFLVEGDWNLAWADEIATRRVELIETPVGSGRPAARFEYYKQPLDLKLTVTPRPTRIALEPQYQVYVDATQLRLEAIYRFRIRGPKATSTNLDLAGWKIDNITSENTAEQALPPAEGVSMVALPLSQMDPAKGELTYRVFAHQSLSAEGTDVRFSLPRPQVDTSAPASVSIQPADNIELTPVVAELKGLVADSGPATAQPSPRQQPALYYRDLGSAEAINFAAARRIRARHTSVRSETLLKLRRGSMEVEQQFIYQISYEGKRSYLLALPPGIAEPNDLQVLQGSQLLEHRPAPETEAGQNLLEVLDLQTQLGRVELTVRYSLPVPQLKPDSAKALDIPLIAPAVSEYDRWLGQQVRVEHADELHVQVPESTDVVDETLQPSERGVLEGKFDRPLTSLELTVSQLQTPELSGLVIDRMWVQTWLAPQQRQERCVLQIRTAAAAVVVRLPVAVVDSNLQVLLDNQGASSSTTGERTVRIELGPATTSPQPHVIELWYSARRSTSQYWIADHRLTPPQVESANSIQRIQPQRIQWQVVLPSHEHLLLDPAEYAPEMKWVWRNYYWSRTATINQRELEIWCGASRQEPLPASLNSYLYSTVGGEPEMNLRTIGQRSLAIWLAGLGLFVGLLVLHVPQVRSATGLVILACVVLGFGMAVPQTMLFVAQVIGLGLVIVAIVAGLNWLWTGHVPAPPVTVARSQSNLSSPRSTGSRSAPPMTTAAAPVLPPTPHEVES
jgi:hypothetical protein